MSLPPLGGHDAHYLAVVWGVAVVLGVVALVCLALLFRRARKIAEAEEVERILAEHDASNRRDSHVSRRHGVD